jgi:hypothetical protein
MAREPIPMRGREKDLAEPSSERKRKRSPQGNPVRKVERGFEIGWVFYEVHPLSMKILYF